jgi:pilus assembly protein TadC
MVSLVLTLVAFYAWAAYIGFYIYWYYVAAAVVVGLMVAYAAMFGYDKLKEILVSMQKKSDAGS